MSWKTEISAGACDLGLDLAYIGTVWSGGMFSTCSYDLFSKKKVKI